MAEAQGYLRWLCPHGRRSSGQSTGRSGKRRARWRRDTRKRTKRGNNEKQSTAHHGWHEYGVTRACRHLSLERWAVRWVCKSLTRVKRMRKMTCEVCLSTHSVFSMFILSLCMCFLTAQSHHRYSWVVHRALKPATYLEPQMEPPLTVDYMHIDDCAYTVTICSWQFRLILVVAFPFSSFVVKTFCTDTEHTFIKQYVNVRVYVDVYVSFCLCDVLCLFLYLCVRVYAIVYVYDFSYSLFFLALLMYLGALCFLHFYVSRLVFEFMWFGISKMILFDVVNA